MLDAVLPDEPLGLRRNDRMAVSTWDLHQTPICGVQHTTYVRKRPNVSPSTKCLISLGVGVVGFIAAARNANLTSMCEALTFRQYCIGALCAPGGWSSQSWSITMFSVDLLAQA